MPVYPPCSHCLPSPVYLQRTLALILRRSPPTAFAIWHKQHLSQSRATTLATPLCSCFCASLVSLLPVLVSRTDCIFRRLDPSPHRHFALACNPSHILCGRAHPSTNKDFVWLHQGRISDALSLARYRTPSSLFHLCSSRHRERRFQKIGC